MIVTTDTTVTEIDEALGHVFATHANEPDPVRRRQLGVRLDQLLEARLVVAITGKIQPRRNCGATALAPSLPTVAESSGAAPSARPRAGQSGF